MSVRSVEDAETRGEQSEYSISTPLNVLGISRSTMRYYERCGILDPKRSEGTSRRRVYSDADIFRVVGCTVAKNSGLTIQDVSSLLGDGPHGASEFVHNCVEQNASRLVWEQAVNEALSRLQRIVDGCAQSCATIEWVERWNLYYDKCEDGYDSFDPPDGAEVQAALLKAMPIASFATWYGPAPSSPRWARAIPATHAGLLPELAEADPMVVGGCVCAVLPCHMPIQLLRDPLFNSDFRVKVESALLEAARKQGCEIGGERFTVGLIPVGEVFYGLACQPLRGTGVKGRRLLARLRPKT